LAGVLFRQFILDSAENGSNDGLCSHIIPMMQATEPGCGDNFADGGFDQGPLNILIPLLGQRMRSSFSAALLGPPAIATIAADWTTIRGEGRNRAGMTSIEKSIGS
jgi:hypothetical protein